MNTKYYIIYTVVLLAVVILPWTNGESGDGDFDVFEDEEDHHTLHGSDSAIIDQHISHKSNNTSIDQDHQSTNSSISNSPRMPAVIPTNPNEGEEEDNDEKIPGEDLYLEEDEKNVTDRGSNSTLITRDEVADSSSIMKSSTGSIILVVVGSLVLILICFIWRIICLRKKRRNAKLRRLAMSNQLLGNDKNQQGRELLEIKHNNGQDTYGVLSKPTVIPISETDELEPMMKISQDKSSSYNNKDLDLEKNEISPTAPPKESKDTTAAPALHVEDDNSSSKSPLTKAHRDVLLNSRPQPVTASFTTTAVVESVHLPTKNNQKRPVSPPPSYDEYISASNDRLNGGERDSFLSDLGPTYR